jgi:membrane protein
VVGFFRAWIERFVEIQGVDRAMSLAALSFSAVIPLLIVYTAVVPRPDEEDFAEELIDRFDLTGNAAESVTDAFSSGSSVEDSLSLLGIMLLIISALSFTRGLQRIYEASYGLESRGWKGTRSGLAWLLALGVYLTIRPLVTEPFETGDGRLAISLVLAAAGWTLTPYLLLGRRLHWKPLLPGAILAAVANTALGISSVIWLPDTIETSAEQYGAVGVSFGILSWLVASSFAIVISTTGGAVVRDLVIARRSR